MAFHWHGDTLIYPSERYAWLGARGVRIRHFNSAKM